VTGCCEYGDEPAGSGVTELVRYGVHYMWHTRERDEKCIPNRVGNTEGTVPF
jgi:hypothetical protein